LFHSGTVYAHLALAQNRVNFLLRDTLETTHQKIIDTLTYIILVFNVYEGDAH
jgi:hypothetical protein